MLTNHKNLNYVLTFLSVFWLESSFAMENAKVLPKGVRNLNIKNVNTSISQKTDSLGVAQSIAQPLAKSFTFKKIISSEKGINKLLLQSFLKGKFDENDSLGDFTADMAGKVIVTAFIIGYGLTDNLTLAVGVPYYQTKMNVKMGFRASENAQKFVSLLNDPSANQTAKAQEVANKLNNAPAELNTKLNEYGYEPIQDWTGSGFGDTTIAAKYQPFKTEQVAIANTTGLIAPTGKINNPDVLISIPTGTGGWGLFNTLAIDGYFSNELWVNLYGKYSYQFPVKKSVRLKTDEEPLNVEKENLRYKLGDRVETGLSLQYEPWFGLVSALGMSYTKKKGDRYKTDNLDAKAALELDSDAWATYLEARLGYQTVPAFLRKEFPLPLVLNFEFKKHVKSRNTLTNNFYTLDLYLFF